MPEHPQRPSSPADLPWGIAYLREDLQDLKHEVRSVHDRIDETHRRIDGLAQSLTARLDGFNQTLNARIDGLAQSLTARLDGFNQTLNARIDGLAESFNARIEENSQQLRGEFHKEFSALSNRIDLVARRQDTHFRWLMTIMIALAGLIIAVLKI